jgi:DNA-binding NtrC family response regulator
LGLDILIIRDHDDQRIALCNLLNATFASGHFSGAKSIAEGLALVCSSNELPDIIMIDIDVPDMSIQAMRWIRTVSPMSQSIMLISQIDEAIDAMNAEASAIMLKHQVIPFLTRLFSNMEGAVQMLAEATYPSRDVFAIPLKNQNSFEAFLRRVYSRTVYSSVTAPKGNEQMGFKVATKK